MGRKRLRFETACLLDEQNNDDVWYKIGIKYLPTGLKYARCTVVCVLFLSLICQPKILVSMRVRKYQKPSNTCGIAGKKAEQIYPDLWLTFVKNRNFLFSRLITFNFNAENLAHTCRRYIVCNNHSLCVCLVDGSMWVCAVSSNPTCSCVKA